MKSRTLVGLLLLVLGFSLGANLADPARAQAMPYLPEWQKILSFMSLEMIDDGTGNPAPTIQIEGANLRIVNGLGSTQTANSTGNLIVGYNEFGNPNGDNRTGSHNISFGEANSFSSFGGLVGPKDNTISGAFTSISGGTGNTANYLGASVNGGRNNTASALMATVSGGSSNWASANYSSIGGGYLNYATGGWSAVSGGSFNEASGDASSVTGGASNTASGTWSAVTGGTNGNATGSSSTVAGGLNRSANGPYDWRAGSLLEDS